MGKSSTVFLFIRRTAVFYFILMLIGILLLVYYYYYLPNNESEYNARGTRVLKTLVENFISRSRDFDSTIPRSDSIVSASHRVTRDFLQKDSSYEILYGNTHYEVRSPWAGTKQRPYIEDSNGWKMVFPVPEKMWKVSLPLKEFGEKLFNARRDIFHTYLLLMPDTEGTAKNRWNIIYKEEYGITTSSQLSLDTLPSLLRNSDQSAIVDVRISDNPEKLFLQSFDFNGSTILMGGLIDKRDYRHYVRHTPVSFISIAIILITLILVVFPFLKIFFLSPNEQITSGDVLSSILSIFIGTAALLIILFFIYTNSVSEQAYQIRMQDVAGKMGKDLENQIDLALKQLNEYDSIYDRLDGSERRALCYRDSSPAVKARLDTQMLPRYFPGLSRISWIDAQGNTLAKWTPYNITPPLTSIRRYEFFHLLAADSTRRPIVVYPGLSNVTGEFQVYMAKRVDHKVTTDVNNEQRDVDASGILMAASLHCTMAPVLPPGFGFCLIDNNAKVLIHSDSRRNLSENLWQETGNNEFLANRIRLRSNGIIEDASLYGEVQDIYLRPVKNQPLFVAVFFDKRKLTNSITRILHFTILSLLYTYLALALVVIFSTYTFSRPSRLRFKLHKIEWVRLSEHNRYSYHFTYDYFKTILLIHAAIFLFVAMFDFDMRIVYYLSLILPLYTLWGFIIGRTHLFTTPNPARLPFGQLTRDLFLTTKSIFVLVLLLNILLFCQGHSVGWGNVFFVLGVQLVYLLVMTLFYRYVVYLRVKLGCTDFSEEVKAKIKVNYLRSLSLSVFLVSVLPATGIYTYGFYSEKVQHKKDKELQVAHTFAARLAQRPQLKAKYLPSIAPYFGPFIDTITRRSGIYLSDNDYVDTQAIVSERDVRRVDGPYRFLVDNLYSFTMPSFGEMTIGDRANESDSSWKFYTGPHAVSLVYRYGLDSAAPVFVNSNFHNPAENFREVSVFFPKGLIFLMVLVLFLYAGWRLIYANMSRLFFFHFSSSDRINDAYLKDIFATVAPDLQYASLLLPGRTPTQFFEDEKKEEGTADFQQEELILKLSHYFGPAYEVIWKELEPMERYMLFDLALDGYTNYKNSDVLYRLINKGIVICRNYQLSFFSYSFRNYVLAKKGTKELQELLSQYSSGGVWQSIRLPAFMLMGAVLIFLVFTQGEVAHDLTALITSAVALIPLLIQLVGKSSKNSS